ncbi:MAG: DUF1460 domain-containing protein [Muribaculaceae bacterium]|nr:DUF1460 domain-containing protein [Muribaculaceae bacterium]
METDTTKITEILIKSEHLKDADPCTRVEFIAKQFLGLPYVAGTLEGGPEMVTVNVDQLDCTTYVETVLAMAYTIGEGRTSWRDFVYNLERMRYRGGELNGYSSRLHYISDWIVDNTHRGNFHEETNRFDYYNYQIKSIRFMTANRDKYPALADSVTYEEMKNVEIGYRNHRFPYIKKIDLSRKDIKRVFKAGDVVALTTRIDLLDVAHLGFITFVDGEPHLMHASMKAMEVIIDKLPLHEYMTKSRNLTGLRVIRLNE